MIRARTETAYLSVQTCDGQRAEASALRNVGTVDPIGRNAIAFCLSGDQYYVPVDIITRIGVGL